MKKNPTSVPSADSTTPPPTDATFRSRASRCAGDPFLDVRGADGKLLARQPRHRTDDRVLLELQQQRAVEVQVALLQVADERRVPGWRMTRPGRSAE